MTGETLQLKILERRNVPNFSLPQFPECLLILSILQDTFDEKINIHMEKVTRVKRRKSIMSEVYQLPKIDVSIVIYSVILKL